MSWSTNHIGSVEKVRELVNKELDAATNMYKGTAEEGDIVGAKLAINASLDAFSKQTYANAVKVEAFGSRCGHSLSIKVDVSGINLDV